MKGRGHPPVATLKSHEATSGNMYEMKDEKNRKYRANRRRKAIEKIAQGLKPVCAICGCPHAEILHIGHPKHRDGRFHRKELGRKGSRHTVAWVLKTPIQFVLNRVQLECPYCNAWHNRFKEYPKPEHQPKWEIKE